MRKVLIFVFALAMSLCASVNVQAEPITPTINNASPDTTITSDSCSATNTATVVMANYSQKELSSKMMSDNTDKKTISLWKNNALDWCKEHLFITGLLGNLLVIFLLWGVYRLIYFFM